MNNYITLDGFRYKTLTNWMPYEERPVTMLFSGRTDVTFGPASYKFWKGSVAVDVTPSEFYGGIDDLKTTYRKPSSLQYFDHLGEEYTVVIDRGIDEKSLSPMWTSPENSINVTLTLIKI